MTATLTQLAANLAKSNLAANLSSGGTTLSVTPGQGALFPNPGANQFFALTLKDAATGTFTEIVYVTARSGDTFTIVRAQEGTSARAWVSGDQANNLFTAGSFSNLVQLIALQQQAGNYASASLGNNSITVTLSTVPAAYTAGLTVRFKKNGNSNTIAATLNVNGLGAIPIVHQDLTATVAGDLPANGVFTVVYDATSTNFVLQGASAGVSLTQLQQQSGNFGADTSGTANALVVTLSPAPASLTAIKDAPIRVLKSALVNTGTSSLTLNGFATTPIIWANGASLGPGDLPASSTFTVSYDGSNFIMQSPTAPATPAGVTATQLQQQQGNAGTDSGTANALVVTLSPAPASLAAMADAPIRILKSGAANTGAATLALNGFTATPIVWGDGSALGAGDLPAGSLFTVLYDGTTNFVMQSVPFLPPMFSDIQTQAGNYVADTGSAANTYVATLSPVLTSLVVGMPVRVLIAHSNTGTSTLNVNGLGAVAIKTVGANNLLPGQLLFGQIAEFEYTGSYFQLQNPYANFNSAANGFTTVPGSILQWGTFTCNPSNTFFNVAVTFSPAFPNNCFIAIPCSQNKFDASSVTTGGAQDNCIAHDISLTGFTVRIDTNDSLTLSGTHTIMWYAIGN